MSAIRQLHQDVRHVKDAVLILRSQVRAGPRSNEQIQTGIQLDLRVEELFRKIRQLPVHDTLDSLLELSDARVLLVANHMSIIPRTTPAIDMLTYVHKLASRSQVQSPISEIDQVAKEIALQLPGEEREAVYRALWELTGQQAGDPLEIGEKLFLSNNPSMNRLKAEACATVALRKYTEESADRTMVAFIVFLAVVAQTIVGSAVRAIISTPRVALVRSEQESDRLRLSELESRIHRIELDIRRMESNRQLLGSEINSTGSLIRAVEDVIRLTESDMRFSERIRNDVLSTLLTLEMGLETLLSMGAASPDIERLKSSIMDTSNMVAQLQSNLKQTRSEYVDLRARMSQLRVGLAEASAEHLEAGAELTDAREALAEDRRVEGILKLHLRSAYGFFYSDPDQ